VLLYSCRPKKIGRGRCMEDGSIVISYTRKTATRRQDHCTQPLFLPPLPQLSHSAPLELLDRVPSPLAPHVVFALCVVSMTVSSRAAKCRRGKQVGVLPTHPANTSCPSWRNRTRPINAIMSLPLFPRPSPTLPVLVPDAMHSQNNQRSWTTHIR